MPEQRYVEALMESHRHSPSRGTVFIPLTEDQDDAPATLVDPLAGFEGNWTRTSDRHDRPARYLRLS